MKYLSFETERLLLKPTTKDDAELIYNLLNSPKWLKYVGDRKVTAIEKHPLLKTTEQMNLLTELRFKLHNSNF